MRYLRLNTDFVICYLMFGLLVSVGCTAKSYVRHEGVPLIKMVSDVNERTTARMNEIAILDAQVQHGVHALDSAAENATEALNQSQQAQRVAVIADIKVTSIIDKLMNLESYNVLVHAAVLFGPGQAHLTPEAKEILDRVGGQLLSASDYVAVVRGRTDSTGGDEYNLNLSKRRATEVARYLVAKYNVPAYRVHAAALGKERPLATNHTADGRRQNRSAEVDILSSMEERWPISPSDSDSDEEVVQLHPSCTEHPSVVGPLR